MSDATPDCEAEPATGSLPGAVPGGLPVAIYDTTLRDGTQREGISLACADKLRIAQQLDALGVDFIEGG
jgi:2-isopropylmalate synthase